MCGEEKLRNGGNFADYLPGSSRGIAATVAINQASNIRVDTFMVGSFV